MECWGPVPAAATALSNTLYSNTRLFMFFSLQKYHSSGDVLASLNVFLWRKSILSCQKKDEPLRPLESARQVEMVGRETRTHLLFFFL